MRFEQLDLDPALLTAIADTGYRRVTSVQEQAIPAALDGRDVLISAPTGTGKTAAYLLPALQHLLDFPRRHPGPPRVLVLLPTRELAYQVADYAHKLTRHTELQCAVITGGVAYQKHAAALQHNLDLLIATPGRLLEYLNQEAFDPRAVEWLIIDEADRTLEMGFGQDVERLAAETQRRSQTLMASATLEGPLLEDFARRLLNEPQTVRIDAPPRSEKNKIHQWLYLADDLNHKQALLQALLNDSKTSSAIVFVRTRDRLQQLSEWLQGQQIEHCWLRGEMPQSDRQANLKRFRDGQVKVLVATDVAARGIHIDNVSHVINFDMPRTADTYVHRIGRTGRAGAKGTAISLVEAHDMAMIPRIERYTGERLSRRVIDGLRPQHKASTLPSRNKKKKTTQAQANTEKKPKQRKRDQRNKGAPKWLKEKAGTKNKQG